jgi:hypothetical protein
MFKIPWQKKGKLLPEKLALIDESMRLKAFDSIADLGGVWGVQGGYLFYAMDRHHLKRTVMVDTHPTPEFLAKAEAYPGLQVIKGNFGEPETAARVGKVGAVLLFDVLLHQVKPDWLDVIRTYAGIADCLIVYNQQWIGGGSTKRLLELGEDEYFRNVPHKRSQPAYANLFRKLDEKHPHHERTWRDVHHIWQWGITDDDLIGVAESCGLQTRFRANYGRFSTLRNFENHGFIFCR